MGSFLRLRMFPTAWVWTFRRRSPQVGASSSIHAERLPVSDPKCGQAFTFPFFMNWTAGPEADPPFPVPTSPDQRSYSMDNFTANQIWTYRRTRAAMHTSGASPGDVSNQNWGPPAGNDYCGGPLLLSETQCSVGVLTCAGPDDALAQARTGWAGGVDFSALGGG